MPLADVGVDNRVRWIIDLVVPLVVSADDVGVDLYSVHSHNSYYAFTVEHPMTIAIKDFRDDMADPINRAAYGGERVVITRRGEGIVALVSMEDLALLEKLEDEIDIKEARKALRERGGIPLEQIKAELGIKTHGKGR